MSEVEFKLFFIVLANSLLHSISFFYAIFFLFFTAIIFFPCFGSTAQYGLLSMRPALS